MKKILEKGQKFGDLEVISYVGIKEHNSIYLCKCLCGNIKEFKLTLLNINKVWHCGCKKWEQKNKIHANLKYEPKEASYRAKIANYKSHAKRRNINWDLSIEEAINLLRNNCYYCNEIPLNYYNVREKHRDYVKYSRIKNEEYNIFYNGIDRINNNLGYTIDNCVSCCTQCNTAKLNFTLDEFKNWIIKLYNNMNKNENTPYKR